MCLIFSLMLILGCEQSAPAPESTSETAKESTPDTPVTEKKESAIPGAKTFEQDGITAEIASWDEAQEFIKKQKGKVVVLDLWSTWCEPCIREYPGLVALQKKYPEQVVCVSFNLNYIGTKDSPPESNSEELMEFYTKYKSDIVNLISSTPDEKVYETLNLAAIPAAYVYAPDGTLKKRFDNEKQEYGEEGFTYEKNITPLIDEMLKTPKSDQ